MQGRRSIVLGYFMDHKNSGNTLPKLSEAAKKIDLQLYGKLNKRLSAHLNLLGNEENFIILSDLDDFKGFSDLVSMKPHLKSLALVNAGCCDDMEPEETYKRIENIRWNFTGCIHELCSDEDLRIIEIDCCDFPKVVAESAVFAAFDRNEQYFPKDSYFYDSHSQILPVKFEAFCSCPKRLFDMKEMVKDFEEGSIIGECQNFTRLLHGPGMFLTPEKFIELVKQKLSIYPKIIITERDESWLKINNMTSVLHVTKINEKRNNEGIASKYLNDTAKLLVIHYNGSSASVPPIVLVGKASFYNLFDDGKALEMPLNKSVPNLSAGASIIGTLLAICRLDFTLNAKGIIPITVHSLHLNKVEPLNFLEEMAPSIQIPHPFEERMLLKDSITYAQSFCPDLILSIATQTSYNALDSSTSVFYSSQDALAELFLQICSYTSEKFIRLPFVEIEDDVFHECVIQKQCCRTCVDVFQRPIPLQVHNTLVNYIKKKWNFCYITPLFLKEFVRDTKWLHLEVNKRLLMMEERSDEISILHKVTGAPVLSLIEFCRKVIKNEEILQT